jgi:hypothetical protein
MHWTRRRACMVRLRKSIRYVIEDAGVALPSALLRRARRGGRPLSFSAEDTTCPVPRLVRDVLEPGRGPPLPLYRNVGFAAGTDTRAPAPNASSRSL